MRMIDDGIYARLRLAVIELAAGEAPVRERLANAFMNRLLVLQPAGFPEDLRDDFESLKHEMTTPRTPHGSPKLPAIVDAMNDEEINAIVKRIIKLFEHTASLYYAQSARDEPSFSTTKEP